MFVCEINASSYTNGLNLSHSYISINLLSIQCYCCTPERGNGYYRDLQGVTEGSKKKKIERSQYFNQITCRALCRISLIYTTLGRTSTYRIVFITVLLLRRFLYIYHFVFIAVLYLVNRFHFKDYLSQFSA